VFLLYSIHCPYLGSITIKIWKLRQSFKPKHNTMDVNVNIIYICHNSPNFRLLMKDNLPPQCFGVIPKKHMLNFKWGGRKGSSNSCNVCQNLQVKSQHRLIYKWDYLYYHSHISPIRIGITLMVKTYLDYNLILKFPSKSQHTRSFQAHCLHFFGIIER
jgi:hypothetical protein